RLRPAQFANTGYVENEEVIQSLRSIYAHGLDPVVLAQRTKEALEAGQLYIIPYPEEKEPLTQHFKQIVDSVLPLEADPEGARKRTEALKNWAKDRAAIMAKGRGG
ncbi:MAG: SDR family NAD(P)-dependent oxidoreductase, partial [Steroidobacteraceae bacterium]